MENLDIQDQTEWTLEEMFNEVAEKEDVIFTIAADSLAEVRKGLASIKHRETKKMEEAGIAADNRKLVFQTLTTDPEALMIKVRIKFAVKKTITVVKVEAPGEF